MQIVIAVVATLVCVIILGLFGAGGFLFFRSVNRFVTAAEANRDLAVKISATMEALSAMPKGTTGSPARSRGQRVKSVGRAACKHPSRNSSETALFPASPDKREMPVVSYSNEEDADKAFRVRELLIERPDLSIEDAAQRVNDEDMRMANIPSLSEE